jgi:putative ABC transport system substrate-binding protein
MQFDLNRRDFITLLGGAAAAWPLAARGQQAGMPVIGFLSGRSPSESQYLVAAFQKGLSEAGFAERQNVVVEYRWAEGDLSRVPALAAELVDRRVVAIAAVGGSEVSLIRSEKAIPIIFNSGPDPVASGLVSSLNRPSGNATGVSAFYYDLEPKRLQILRELAGVKIVAALMRPNAPNAEARINELRVAAIGLGMQVHILHADSEGDIDAAFQDIVRLRADALLTAADPFFNTRRDQLVRLAARHAIPTIFHTREMALAGGLMSYGGSIADAYRQVGIYVGRILRGVKVADLPVQLATKVEFVINLKTARALGLTVPLPLLGRADEVIE